MILSELLHVFDLCENVDISAPHNSKDISLIQIDDCMGKYFEKYKMTVILFPWVGKYFASRTPRCVIHGKALFTSVRSRVYFWQLPPRLVMTCSSSHQICGTRDVHAIWDWGEGGRVMAGSLGFGTCLLLASPPPLALHVVRVNLAKWLSVDHRDAWTSAVSLMWPNLVV